MGIIDTIKIAITGLEILIQVLMLLSATAAAFTRSRWHIMNIVLCIVSMIPLQLVMILFQTTRLAVYIRIATIGSLIIGLFFCRKAIKNLDALNK